jgi:hypothetical protein
MKAVEIEAKSPDSVRPPPGLKPRTAAAVRETAVPLFSGFLAARSKKACLDRLDRPRHTQGRTKGGLGQRGIDGTRRPRRGEQERTGYHRAHELEMGW